MFLAAIILLFTLAVLLHFYFQYTYNYWKRRNIPYAKPIPLIGNILPVLMLKQQISLWFQDQYKAFDSDYFGIFGLTKPILVVKSPKLVKDILIKDFSVFDNRTTTISKHDKVARNMLFVRDNPSWKRVRTKVSPAFTSGRVKLMFPLIQHEMDKFIKHIKENLVNNEWTSEIKCLTSKFTINLISRTAMGNWAIEYLITGEINSRHNPGRVNAVEEVHNKSSISHMRQYAIPASNRVRLYIVRFLPLIVKLFNVHVFGSETPKRFAAVVKDIANEREKLNDANPDLLNILIELKKKSDADFNDTCVAGVVLNYFAASFETTSGLLAFTFYELAINPDLQEILRKEIFDTIAKYDNKITYEAINEMKYLDMVICETLRKYPSLPFLDRLCNRDYKFKDTDFVVEKGTPVYLSLLGLHYDEKYFPNPEKFDPERFRNKDDINKDGLLYYMPFGEGPRNCIGARFGSISSRLAVATVISNFKLSKAPTTPVPVIFDIQCVTLTSTVGLPLTLTAINQ